MSTTHTETMNANGVKNHAHHAESNKGGYVIKKGTKIDHLKLIARLPTPHSSKIDHVKLIARLPTPHSSKIDNLTSHYASQVSVAVEPHDHRLEAALKRLDFQNLNVVSHEGILLLRELRRTRSANMTPGEIWSCLCFVAERNFFASRCNAPAMVELYFASDAEDYPFFTEMFRWLVENYEPTGGEKAHSFSSHTYRYSCDIRSLLTEEVGRQLEPISRIYALAKTSPTDQVIVDEQRLRARFATVCEAIMWLVQENILKLADIWIYLGSDDFVNHHEKSGELKLQASVQALYRKYSNIPFKVNSFVPLASRYLLCSEISNPLLSWQDPLHVWVLWWLLMYGTDAGQTAIPYFEKHQQLALGFASLRVPLLKCLKSSFDKGDLSSKFSILKFAAKVLGPHLGQNFAFFQQACSLCEAHFESHMDLVIELLGKLLLPALSLCNDCDLASSLVWKVLSNVDPQSRSQMYAEWRKMSLESWPALQATTTIIQDDISTLMRHFTLQTTESVGKSVAHLLTRNPLIAWRRILLHTDENEDLIPALVDFVALHYNPLCQETLLFIIYDTLCDKSDFPFQGDCIYPMRWFEASSFLFGCLFAQSIYLPGALVSYLSFLAKRIPTYAASLHLFLDLLTCASDIKPLRGLSDTEVATLGGSALLKRQIFLPMTTATLVDLPAGKCPPNNEVLTDQQESARASDFSCHASPTSFKALLTALDESHLIPHILTTLSRPHMFRDVPTPSQRGHSHMSLFVALQFLFVLDLADALGSDGDIASLRDEIGRDSFPLYIALRRMSLRSQIASRSLEFVHDIASLPKTKGVDPTTTAFFWSLEAYDIYVPESEYAREIAWIGDMNKDRQPSRAHLVDCLKADLAAHKAHVSWLLPQLPKLDESDTVSFLKNVALPRAKISQQDAHFVFCFLARTLEDPVPLLDALFDHKLRLALKYCDEHEIRGINQLLFEIWRDLRSWPSGKNGKNLGVRPSDLCSDDDTASNVSTSTDADRGTYGTCTLFRGGMDTETLLGRWEEETSAAIGAAMNYITFAAKKNAVRFLFRIAAFLPLLRDPRYSLMQKQLRSMASNAQDAEVAALARNVIEAFGKHQMDVEVCCQAKAEESDAMRCAVKRRKTK